jgi:hypothetical protein
MRQNDHFWQLCVDVTTLALGSRPRQGVARLWAKRKTRESHHMLLGMPKSVREWTLTLPRELHVGSWNPKWTPKSSKCNCKGQNPSTRRVLYIIEKLLKPKCLKWGRIAHLNIWNTSYEPKKGRESNWQFDSRPLKVGNQPNFLACKKRATYYWKAFGNGYNISSDLIAIGGLHTKLWAPKLMGIPAVGISGLALGSPRTKSHLDVAPMERRIIYYKGGRWWLPPSPGRGEFYKSELPMARPSTKSAPTMH